MWALVVLAQAVMRSPYYHRCMSLSIQLCRAFTTTLSGLTPAPSSGQTGPAAPAIHPAMFYVPKLDDELHR